MDKPPSPAKTRFHFVDLLRGWAVFVMIETHVVNALLHPSIKDEQFFKILTFFNGLVAPSFLFCAGFAYVITAHRKWQDYVALKPALWRYLLRLGFILVVGYSLHLPFFSLRQLLRLSDESLWMPFFQSDILQVIAITLFVSVLLTAAARSEKTFVHLTLLAALAIIFTSPILREMDHTSLPIWFRPYLTTQFKSQFPLFPWSAFLMAGVVIGYWFVIAREAGTERSLTKRLLGVALGAIVLSLLVEVSPISLYPQHNFWRASPEFFFVRFGLVVLLGVLLVWRERRPASVEAPTSPRPPSMVTLFGQESLLVYVVHLLVVYGQTHEWSLIRLFGPTLNYLECFGVFALLATAMYVLAFAWHWAKGWNKRVASIVQFATLATIVVVFVLKE